MGRQDLAVELYYGGAWRPAPTYARDPVTITRGHGDEATEVSPSKLTGTVDNRSGNYNPRNASSPLYGLVGRNTPVRGTVNGDVRFVGEVATWKPGRSLDADPTNGQGDAWTEIEGAGILRRYGQGADPTRSALYRAHMVEPTAVAYWPLEDAGAAELLTSPLPGVASGRLRDSGARTIRPLQWSDDSLVGSGTLPVLETERGLAGVEVSTAPGGAPALAVSFWTRTALPAKTGANGIFTQATLTLFRSDGADVDATLLSWPPGSTGAGGTADTVELSASAGAPITVVRPFVDGWRHVAVVFAPSGSSLTVTLYLDGAQVGTGTLPSASIAGVFKIRMGVFTQNLGSSEIGKISVGHPAILAGSTAALAAAVTRLHTAGRGHVGETAAARFLRLCGEEGIPATVVGVAADTRPMGPQRTGVAMADLLGEIERTDGGLLYEPRDQLGLVLRTVATLYNQPPALTLDWSQVAEPFDPVVDDLGTRNDVTAKSTASGVEARAVLKAGPMSVQPPPAGIGRYAGQVDVNPADDATLPDHAWWGLHRGAVDELRVSQLTVDLAAWPALAPAAAAVDVGDRIMVTNLPADMGDREVSLIVLGVTEVIGSDTRTITYACVPASPYEVATVGGNRLVCADGTALAAGVTAGALVMQITSTAADGPWTTAAGDMPVEMRVGGEWVQAASIGPAVVDGFPRTVSAGWGAAETGQPWTPTQVGTEARYSCPGSPSVGRMSVEAVNTRRMIWLDAGSPDVDVLITIALGTLMTGGSAQFGLMARYTDTDNQYWAELAFETDQRVTLRVQKRVAGANTNITGDVPTGLTHTTGGQYRLRFQAIGSQLRAKAWVLGNAEPAWQWSGTDTSLTTGNRVGVRGILAASVTNPLPIVVAVDDLAVLNPQRAILSVRGVNGVRRSWPAGTPVDVWDPAIVAL
ncbi:hypothetical protein AB0C02_30390 [Micromonospora sp. NPDC048999]|uniref:hypothetical protein n=1 Tax=Micromonospora sp. NPDC048999 TaxID=3155391 RepID=UPI0033F0C73C